MSETLRLCLHIVRRNWAVYRKDFLANISPTVADPALNFIALGMGLAPFVAELDGRTFMQFLAPGLTMATALFTSFFESSYGFYVRMTYENIFKAMLTTPIGPREIVIGEYLWVGLKGAFMSTGVALVLLCFGLMKDPLQILWLPFVGMLVSFPCAALGLISTGLVRNINQFQSVYSFVIAPLYFLSGIFFPLERMPTALQYVLYAFPMAPGVRLAQGIFWDTLTLSEVLIFGGSLILQTIVLGWISLRIIRRKLIPE